MKKVRLAISGMTCEHCARIPEGESAKGRGAAPTRGRSDHDDRPDLLVIGTGAAGMAAAIRGAELGARVAIVEDGTVGGTCVNVGCIPSKTLLAAAAAYHATREGFPGVDGCSASVSWTDLRERKRELVASLRQSKYVDVLAEYPEIALLRGRALFNEKKEVQVAGLTYQAGKVVIATGTSPWIPPIAGLESVEVLTSTTAMELDELPASMIVLGGSAVGLELGQMFARLGVSVTVLEILPRLLAGEDEDAGAELRRCLEAEGLKIVTGAHITEAARGDDRPVVVRVAVSGQERTFKADTILVATGRRANTSELGLDQAGVARDANGFIRVDDGMRTSNRNIFAAGDVTGGPGFVYVAAASGRVATDNAVGEGGRTLDLRAVPRVTFTSPQVASVGLGPGEAHEHGLDVEVSRLGLEHVPRALVEHRTTGWIQVIAERGTGRIVGVQAVGPNAAELLGEATLAVRLGLTIEEVTDTFHPYLTWVEGFKLAVQAFRKDVSKLSCCA